MILAKGLRSVVRSRFSGYFGGSSQEHYGTRTLLRRGQASRSSEGDPTNDTLGVIPGQAVQQNGGISKYILKAFIVRLQFVHGTEKGCSAVET